jgi:restriction system protein
MLVGEWFRRQGYAVGETGGVADGGVDVMLTRAGETYLVQCKQWKAYKVGVNIVRELLGAMTSHGAAGGFIVTSGAFTQEAKRFASDSNITLIDGTQLFYVIRSSRISQPSQPEPAPASHKPVTPTCPKCGSDMILRKASRGRMDRSILLGLSEVSRLPRHPSP